MQEPQSTNTESQSQNPKKKKKKKKTPQAVAAAQIQITKSVQFISKNTNKKHHKHSFFDSQNLKSQIHKVLKFEGKDKS